MRVLLRSWPTFTTMQTSLHENSATDVDMLLQAASIASEAMTTTL